MLMKRNCRVKGIVVLTYDDGPSIETSPELLDLLECTQTRATFFVQGRKVEENRGTLQKMVSLGHEIGCHGYDHLNAWTTLPWTSTRDITKGFKALAEAQVYCRLFRPPYGKVTIISLITIAVNNLKCVWWTQVSGDTYSSLPDPVDFSEAVVAEGGVVLMHDHHKSKLRKEFVLKATALIIEKSKARGLKIKTLGEIV